MSFFAHSPRVRGIAIANLLVGTCLLAACGSGSGYSSSSTDPNPPPGSLDVAATPALRFTPPTLTAHVGDAVTFVFGSVVHNVYFDATEGAPADIPGAIANQSVQRVFTTAGTFHYECHIHPGMAGTIEVQPATATR